MQKEKLKNLLKSGKFLDFLTVLSFVASYILIVLISTDWGKYSFGSEVDFITQHFTLPEYIRTLFYETGDLFPDFAFNLGAGMNIYNISYYGLLDPFVVLSYLFPFVSMRVYLMITMAVVVISSASLFYFYLKKNGYGRAVSYVSAFLFFCATPLTFHAHRHFMFVNYMPFLVMGLYGVDKYVYKKKSWLLVLSITLTIFTSYYFSISAMVALFIFSCFKYVRENGFVFKKVFDFAWRIAIRFLIAVIISAVLVLPTFYALFTGRSDSTTAISLLSLFKPGMTMLYKSYSMGLTLISLVAAIYMLFSKKVESIIVSAILLAINVFPVFNYALNGFLYINAKSLIPFIPLALVNTADFIIFVKGRLKFKRVLAVAVIISAFAVCINTNDDEEYILRSKINDSFNAQYEQSVEDILSKESSYRINSTQLGKEYMNKVTNAEEYKTSIYSSVFSEEYRKACRDLFENAMPHRNEFMLSASNSPIFQTYMGEKYLYTKTEYAFFYELVETYGDKKLYKNPYAFSIGYATSDVINEDEFEKLGYPQKMLNILGRAVIDKNTNTEIINADEVLTPEYTVETKENIEVKETQDALIVIADKDGTATVKLTDESLKGKLLLINFDVTPVSSTEPPKSLSEYMDTERDGDDLKITINEIVNKLTNKDWKYFNNNTSFAYTIINSDNLLEVKFDPGVYEMKNFKLYSFDHSKLGEINQSVDHFVIDADKTKGDIIAGSIDVREDGYFMLSVPYDKGFTVKVDGKETEFYKANGAFIGFDISAGKHNIEIEYESPLKKEGLILTICGILLFAGLIIIEGRRKNGKDNDNSTLLQ